MDFLTTPILTLGFPLVVFIAVNKEKDRLKTLFTQSFIWLLGYASIWASKWLIGWILTGENIIDTDLKEFYPNSMLITGFDILFFWVARMMFQSSQAVGELPFKDIYLHALVKDKDGKKMSKSSGNVVDPLEKIDEFSADILRTSTMSAGVISGETSRFSALIF